MFASPLPQELYAAHRQRRGSSPHPPTESSQHSGPQHSLSHRQSVVYRMRYAGGIWGFEDV